MWNFCVLQLLICLFVVNVKFAHCLHCQNLFTVAVKRWVYYYLVHRTILILKLLYFLAIIVRESKGLCNFWIVMLNYGVYFFFRYLELNEEIFADSFTMGVPPTLKDPIDVRESGIIDLLIKKFQDILSYFLFKTCIYLFNSSGSTVAGPCRWDTRSSR